MVEGCLLISVFIVLKLHWLFQLRIMARSAWSRLSILLIMSIHKRPEKRESELHRLSELQSDGNGSAAVRGDDPGAHS